MHFEYQSAPSWLRLRTLVRLRWLAVVGQLLAVLSVHYGFGFSLPLGGCIAVVSFSAWLNIFLHIRQRGGMRLNVRSTTILLGLDIAQLSALLYLTGGLVNPFSVLLLVPVIVAASALPVLPILGLTVLAILCASVLAWFNLPLPWFAGDQFQAPLLYVAGIWAALSASLVFVAIYMQRIASDARQMTAALAATEQVMAREQQLHALDGLAAAAAHELGTPLATISVVAKEMLNSISAESELAEDAALLKSQADRCGDILAKLTSLRDEPHAEFETVSLVNILENIAADHAVAGKTISVQSQVTDQDDEPVFYRDPSILYGIGNLIENAATFADKNIEVSAHWGRDSITIIVSDDGPGFAPDIISRLGEPYVIDRHAAAKNSARGLGLGIFIAKTLLERSGAELAMRNKVPPDRGAVVRVIWPRANLEQG